MAADFPPRPAPTARALVNDPGDVSPERAAARHKDSNGQTAVNAGGAQCPAVATTIAESRRGPPRQATDARALSMNNRPNRVE